MTDRVKIRCAQCGKLIARIVEDHAGVVYFRGPLGGGISTTNPRGIFCSEHGWPDLDRPELAATLARARAAGKILTYRAATRLARYGPKP